MERKPWISIRFFICVMLALTLVIPTTALAGSNKGGGKPGKEEPPTNPEPKQQIVYTALGDSIATGNYAFGMDIPYVQRYRDLLSQTYDVDFLNLAVSGIDSSELLAQLNDDTRLSRISSSDIITISIGGNNILHCRGYNFTSIDGTCAQAGIQQFAVDWPLIIQKINDNKKPNTIVYVNSLYNPYKGNDPMYNEANQYIESINSIIRDYNSSYTIVDVYTAFSGYYISRGKTRWRVCDYTYFCNWIRDPHPNDAGHRKIAELHPIPIIIKEESQ